MMLFLLQCLALLPFSGPSLAIAYRFIKYLISCILKYSVRLIRNKSLGSVFNVTTTAMFIVIGKAVVNILTESSESFSGLFVPILTAVNISLLVGTDRMVACLLKPFISWLLYVTIFTVLPLSLLYKLAFLIVIVLLLRVVGGL